MLSSKYDQSRQLISNIGFFSLLIFNEEDVVAIQNVDANDLDEPGKNKDNLKPFIFEYYLKYLNKKEK